MTHYHVTVGSSMGLVTGDALYANEDESLVEYLCMVKSFYSNQSDMVKYLDFHQIKEQANLPDAVGFYLGLPHMLVAWRRCDDCSEPTDLALLN